MWFSDITQAWGALFWISVQIENTNSLQGKSSNWASCIFDTISSVCFCFSNENVPKKAGAAHLLISEQHCTVYYWMNRVSEWIERVWFIHEHSNLICLWMIRCFEWIVWLCDLMNHLFRLRLVIIYWWFYCRLFIHDGSKTVRTLRLQMNQNLINWIIYNLMNQKRMNQINQNWMKRFNPNWMNQNLIN